MTEGDAPKENLDDYLKEVLSRKEKYLSEHKEYRKFENLFHRHTAGKYVGDLIYGANDGIITTFAVVAGAAGASLSAVVVIILGLANLVADGFSMGASNYLGKQSERDYARAQRKKEEWEIDHLREIEVAEVREIFDKKGFRGRDLARAVEIVTSDRKVWVDMMMKDELGIIEEERDDPKKHGAATFAAFVVAGFCPLIPYLLPFDANRFALSAVFSGMTLFLAGALRSTITTVSWVRGGLEVLLIGSSAALGAYIIGNIVDGIIR